MEQKPQATVGVKDGTADRPPIGAASPQKKQRTPTKPVNLTVAAKFCLRPEAMNCKDCMGCSLPSYKIVAVSAAHATKQARDGAVLFCAGPAQPNRRHVWQSRVSGDSNGLTARCSRAARSCSRAAAAHAAPIWQVWCHGDDLASCSQCWPMRSKAVGHSSSQQSAQAVVCRKASCWRLQMADPQ
jgi:hypothetical protein